MARIKTATMKTEGKEQDKAYLSLSSSQVHVEGRGGLRSETNLWRK
jgi:hypothetical protein